MGQQDWTPARGVDLLVARFGADGAFRLLTDLIAGLPPDELARGSYAEVLRLIGNGPAEGMLRVRPGERPGARLDHWPRSWAARAFAYLGDPSAGPWLVAALDDPHWWVRKTAAQSLGRLRVTGCELELVRALGDPRMRVRRAAVLALERVGSQQSLEALQGALDDEDGEVRSGAERALEAISARGEES